MVLGAVIGSLTVYSHIFDTTPPNQPSTSQNPHYEVIGTVALMVDGDTTLINIENIVGKLDPEGDVKTGELESIRYGGGIDAPETWTTPPENGGLEAKSFIENTIPVGTKVYIDLNELSMGGTTGRPYRDAYERLVGVIYFENDGKWINVNAEVLRWGLKEYPNHNWLRYSSLPSEWDYNEWLADNYPYVSGTY